MSHFAGNPDLVVLRSAPQCPDGNSPDDRAAEALHSISDYWQREADAFAVFCAAARAAVAVETEKP